MKGSATAPLASYADVNNNNSSRTYMRHAVPKVFKGKLVKTDNRVEIVVADNRSDDKFDYLSLIPEYKLTTCYKSESSTWVTYPTIYPDNYLSKYPVFVQHDITPDMWGCKVTVTDVTYNGEADGVYSLTLGNGKALSARKIFDVDVKGTSELDPEAGKKYQVTGEVEYDADKDEYFLAVTAIRNLVPVVEFGEGKSTITDGTFEGGSGTEEDPYIFSAESHEGKLAFSIQYNSTYGALFPNRDKKFAYIYDANGVMPGAWTVDPSYGVTMETTTATLNASTVALYNGTALQAKDGYLSVKLVVGIGTSTCVDAYSEPVYIKIKDKYASMAAYGTTLAEMRESLAAKAELPEYAYVRSADLNKGNLVIRGMYGGYMIVSDVDDANAENVQIFNSKKHDWVCMHNGDNKEWVDASFTKYINKKCPDAFCRQKSKTANSGATLHVGDEISVINGVPVMEDGNLIIDATGFNSYGQRFIAKYDVATMPRHADIVESEQLTTFRDPANSELTVADVNKMVIIRNLKAAKVGENYVAKMKNDVVLAWTYFVPDETDVAAQKAAIDGASADDSFQAKAVVLNDGNGGVKLEIITLEPEFAQELAVCYHEGHDSYYKSHEFDAQYDGRIVNMQGVKVVRTGTTATDFVYTALLGKNVVLDGESLYKAFGQTTLAAFNNTYFTTANIEDYSDDDFTDAKVHKQLCNISGTLIVEGDGTYKMSVQSAKFISVPAASMQMEVCAYWSPGIATQSLFLTYSLPSFETGVNLTRKQAHLSGKVYYRLLKITEENAELANRMKKDEAAQAIADVEYQLYDPENMELLDCSYWIEGYICMPGAVGFLPTSLTFIEHYGMDKTSISDVIESGSGSMHYRNNLRVAASCKDTRFLVLTDGKDVINGYFHGQNGFDKPHEMPELNAGDYVGEITLWYDAKHYKINATYDSNVFTPLAVVDAPADEMAMPVAVDLSAAADVASVKSKLVKGIGGKIAKSGDDYILEIAKSDGEGTIKLPVTTHLGWDPSTLAADDDAEFIVEGYVFPRVAMPTAVALADDAAVAETYEHELWATSVEVRRKTAAPTFAVSDEAESRYGDEVVTTEDITVSIECAEEGDVTIEYSIDGSAWGRVQRSSCREEIGDHQRPRHTRRNADERRGYTDRTLRVLQHESGYDGV